MASGQCGDYFYRLHTLGATQVVGHRDLGTHMLPFCKLPVRVLRHGVCGMISR